MHLHILGICGTFMGSLAVLARELGHQVTGSDANVYPPMSTQLAEQGITLQQGYQVEHLQPEPDLVIIGNALSRGNPAVEYVLDKGLAYTSGPQWLYEHVLRNKWVLAVAGTHGKTTTTSMLAWILEYAGMKPGFLVGGVPSDFGISARLGDSTFFVVEADEYDSAFFDKRSKFIHYHPRTLILNNLEFDHADIFADLAAIQTQFHHLLRTVPAQGRIIMPANDDNLRAVIAKGCWSEVQEFTPQRSPGRCHWQAGLKQADGCGFEVLLEDGATLRSAGTVNWQQTGEHNINNGLAAIAAAHHVGVRVETAVEALSQFQGVRRRMELLGVVKDISVYDDFAHHPTAIKTTLAGLRAKVGKQRILAVIEPRSNTMRMGHHREGLAASVADADYAIWYQPPELGWDLASTLADSPIANTIMDTTDAILTTILEWAKPGDHIVIMSNGGFGGIHQRLIKAL